MTTRTPTRRKGLSVAEARNLPVMFDIWPTLGQACDIGRTTTYQLARENALPIPVVRVGRQFRAKRSDLLGFLGIEDNSEGAAVATATPSDERITTTA